jgi:MFS family permease
MFYQLKSFTLPDGSPPSDSTVASQAGLLAAAFTGAQFCTAILWGRLADWDGLGRKRVILIGLLGTCVGSLGFGFSNSFWTAMGWRALGGILNGNVGVMRTMISEIVKEKKFQSRAFLLMPMTFNIGVIVGPLLGGLLADPAGSYPGLFGPGGKVGGKDGVWLFVKWPYALPNLVNAVFLFGSALGVLFGLEETLESIRDKPDYPLRFSRWLIRTIFRRSRPQQAYTAIAEHDFAATSEDIELNAPSSPSPQYKTRQKLPFRRIWTPNLLLTLLAHGLLAMHVGTFSNLLFVFLSTPRYNPDSRPSPSKNTTTTLPVPENYHPHAPFTFTGGLALPPPSIGAALSILGLIGITLQLALYPRLSTHLGVVRSYRFSLLLFPISCSLVPYLATIPSSSPPPGQAAGVLVWVAISVVLAIQVMARTFALPSTAILVNNASPHPSVLGTVHGIAQSVSSATRTLGPVLAGWLYGVGLHKGIVGLAWWCLAGIAVLGAVAGRWVREGDGHEILMEGEEKEEEGKG